MHLQAAAGVNWRTQAASFRVCARPANVTLVTSHNETKQQKARAMFKVSKVSKAISPQRWFTSWRAAMQPVYGSDPADLGTAFGLDLSLMETPPEPVLLERRPGWMRRLTTRRRTAT